VPVPLTVGANGRVVVHAAHHVRPVTLLDLAVRGFLEIHHAESLFRIGDDVGQFRRPLRVCAHPPQRGDVRARGQKSKESTAIVGR
jgi:hypothetical protein